MPRRRGPIEIIVLGRGFGESIVVSLGTGEWVIVDSFLRKPERGQGTGTPAPLAYLHRRGVDVARNVRAVVLTHLHADHCEGIGEVVRQCATATFSLPSAVPFEQWDDIMRIIRGEQNGAGRKLHDIANAFRYATDDERFQPLFAGTTLKTSVQDLTAMAPTTAAHMAAQQPTRQMNPRAARGVLRENYTSIALWMQVGGAVALLGADMDNANAKVGWRGVLKEHAPRSWKGATFVKVPHHGSKHAHSLDVYRTWTLDPVAVLTPNLAGELRRHLPPKPMLRTLKRVSQGVWLAGPRSREEMRVLDTEGSDPTVEVVAVYRPGKTPRWDVTPDSARL